MDIAGTQTEQNFKNAITGEHHALEKFLRWSSIADVVGPPEVHTLYRLTGMLTSGHANIGEVYKNTLFEAMENHHHHHHHINGYQEPDPEVEFTAADVEKYLAYAQTAQDEGFAEIADWFTALAEAERSQIP